MARQKKQEEISDFTNESQDGGTGKNEKRYVIASYFVDKNDFSKSYLPGSDIPDSFDKNRIESLLKLGLIKEK